MNQSVSTSTRTISLGVKFAACAVAFLLVGLGVGYVLLRNNTPTQTEPTPTQETLNQVCIKVQYDGQWQGMYAQWHGTYEEWQIENDATLMDYWYASSWNGTGDKSVTLTRPMGTAGATWVIFASIQKLESSTKMLTVRATKLDGTLLQVVSTYDSNELVIISYMIEGNGGCEWPPPSITVMKIEELKIQGHTWTGAPPASITLTVKNTGTMALTLVEARVNGVQVDTAAFTPTTGTLQPGDIGTVVITEAFVSGVRYEFRLITATGNGYTYVATAP